MGINHTYRIYTIFSAAYGLISCCIIFPQLFYLVTGNLTSSSYNTDCDVDSGCLKCHSLGCMKCINVIIADTRKCADQCPYGYKEKWSTVPEFMGRLCEPSGLMGFSLTTIVGAVCGILACGILLTIILIATKRRQRRKSIQEKLIDDTIERSDFLRQLDELRPNAQYFLAMLNDTRRQIRKLYLANDVAGAQAYRPVVRDLAKLLIILNKPVEALAAPPHDWSRLAIWAETVLDRYKPQIAQLIDFLQAPSSNLSDPRLGSCQHSTFKSTTTTTTTTSDSSNLHQMQIFGSLISLHDLDQPHTSDPYNNPFKNTKCYFPTKNFHGSSLWLEDEFFKLGFRPQDEITTEL